MYLSLAFLLSTVVYGAVLGGYTDHWRSMALARIDAALVGSGFGIREIVVKGRVHAPAGLIKESLGAQQSRTIFGFDTRAARKRLETVGWVRKARVMRLWPSTLVVELDEREAFARWSIRGHTLLIDRGGHLLGPATPDFDTLPRVAGEGADKAAAVLVERLAAHEELAKQVALAERVERRRWDLHLSSERHVMLPAEGVDAALRLLAQMLRIGLPDDATVVDMRVAGLIALRAAPADEGRIDAPAQVSATMSRPAARQL
jgi:cell division protein FtsQ